MATNCKPLLEEIERRIAQFYHDLTAGRDIAPAVQYRTEGLMQAALLLGLLTEEQLQQLKQQAYQRAFGQGLPEHSQGRPCELLLIMPRAPVYPSSGGG